MKNKKQITKEEQINTAEILFAFYLLINGVMPIKELDKIVIDNKVDPEVLNANKEKIMNECDIEIYDNDYYVLKYLIETEAPIDELILMKNIFTYVIVSNDEMLLYFSKLARFTREMMDLLKSTESTVYSIVYRMMIEPFYQEEIVEIIKSKFKLGKKRTQKLIDIIDWFQDELRFWTFNGRTYDEFRYYEVVEIMSLNKKPKDDTISSCLAAMSDKGIKLLLERYPKKNISNVKNEIIKDFKEEVKMYDQDYAKQILKCNHKDFNNDIWVGNLYSGFIFVYKDKGKFKTLFPNELNEILNNINIAELIKIDTEEIDELKDEEIEQAYKEFMNSNPDQEASNQDIIEDYILMNGVIEKTKLQYLLKENHNINLSINEMDKIILENKIAIIIENVYSCILNLTKEDIKKYIEEKNKFGKYRTWDYDISCNNMEFELDLAEYISSNLDINEGLILQLLEGIQTFVKRGLFNIYSLTTVINTLNLNLKDTQTKKLYDFINKRKNDVSIWDYNGFTYNEVMKLNEKIKVGRNEPCVCGSGKKYKQCCGK